MRIGFSLPQVGPHAHHFDQLPGYAKAVEDLGADSLWVSDRILAPVNPTVGYAGTDVIPEAFHSVLDPFALVTAAGVVTERVQIGTNVLIAPWYPPVLLARALTTLDIVTNGRFVLGLGVGWSPEEYQSVNVPMKQRGARLEECLDILAKFWTDNPVEHTGKHWTVPATYVALKPVRKPPIYLGAFSPAAFERIGRRADGWMPSVMTSPDFSTDFLAQGIATMRAAAEKAGRDPSALDVIVRFNPPPGHTLDNIITAVKRARDEVNIPHSYVDVNPLAGYTEALDTAGAVLDGLS
ncbi:MAG: TIGR03619 family F420-dependent LLM class oxidoreductase [Kibdelosporangium sp.]